MDSAADARPDLYAADILEWSRQQGAVLRRIAAGARRNDDRADWDNIAEEIESVGRSELRACESLLTQAMLHILKVQAWPESSATPGWRTEILRFRFEAIDAYTPSMRQRVDVNRLYARALRLMPVSVDGQPKLPVPDTCPFTLDDLLTADL